MARRHTVFAFLLVLFLQPGAFAQTPVAYRLSFPEAAHHLMQVEATFTTVPPGPLELRMSRSSPGRYALHEFAKNVFDVRITDEAGKALAVSRPNPHEWDVTGARRDRASDLQGLRRSTRRHVPRGRCLARAHQYASRHHVGARLRAPAGHDPLRAPDRHVMARGNAAHSGERPAVVHGAQPAVPDGQSVGIRHLHAAVVHGARRSAYSGLPRRGAPHRHGRRGGRPRS